jgi:AAA15 family ATPase/GTPase
MVLMAFTALLMEDTHMLLQFSTENYKTFKEEMVFDMTANPNQEGMDLDYSLIHRTIDNEAFKILCSSVIVGPNASGKTNLFSAMDTLRSIILRGNILNAPDASSQNKASCFLERIPNSHNPHKPVAFSIAFIESDYLIEYSLEIDLGAFLTPKYDRKVVSERLDINNKMIFKREFSDIVLGELDTIKHLLNPKFPADLTAVLSMEDTDLFLVNNFKSLCSIKLVALIKNWIENKFIIVFNEGISSFNLRPSHYLRKTLNEAVFEFGANNPIYFVQDGAELKFASKTNDKILPSEEFESRGTLKFLEIFPVILEAYSNGATLVIDEFPFNLHTDGVLSIINAFHHDAHNIQGAQLIFNTHNLGLLTHAMFRRDEIKLMEFKDNCNELYSIANYELSDRDLQYDYDKNYLFGMFGAIKNVEFDTILQKTAKESHEEDEI